MFLSFFLSSIEIKNKVQNVLVFFLLFRTVAHQNPFEPRSWPAAALFCQITPSLLNISGFNLGLHKMSLLFFMVLSIAQMMLELKRCFSASSLWLYQEHFDLDKWSLLSSPLYWTLTLSNRSSKRAMFFPT